MPIFQTYLCDLSDKLPKKSRTTTRDSDIAKAEFAALVNRTELDDQHMKAVVLLDGTTLASHLFSFVPGPLPSNAGDWRGRIEEISWPMSKAEKVESQVVKPSDVKKIGRPVELLDGKRINIYLDASRLEKARKIGGGNVSEGIRSALDDALLG